MIKGAIDYQKMTEMNRDNKTQKQNEGRETTHNLGKRENGVKKKKEKKTKGKKP